MNPFGFTGEAQEPGHSALGRTGSGGGGAAGGGPKRRRRGFLRGVSPPAPSHSSLSPGRHPVPSRCQAPSCQGGQCPINSSTRRCVRPLPTEGEGRGGGAGRGGGRASPSPARPRAPRLVSGAAQSRGVAEQPGRAGRRRRGLRNAQPGRGPRTRAEGGAEAGRGGPGGGASSPAPPRRPSSHQSLPAGSGPGRPRGNPGPRPSCLARLRELRQPGQRTDHHPGHERLPDRHEEAQGATEAAQRRQSPVLSAGGSVPRGRPGLAQVTGDGRGTGTGRFGKGHRTDPPPSRAFLSPTLICALDPMLPAQPAPCPGSIGQAQSCGHPSRNGHGRYLAAGPQRQK